MNLVALQSILAMTAARVADGIGVVLAILAVVVLFRFDRGDGSTNGRSGLVMAAALCLGVAGALLIYVPDDGAREIDVAAPTSTSTSTSTSTTDPDADPVVGPTVDAEASTPTTEADPADEGSTTTEAAPVTTEAPTSTSTSTSSSTTTIQPTTTTAAPTSVPDDDTSADDVDADDTSTDDDSDPAPEVSGTEARFVVADGDSFWSIAEQIVSERNGDAGVDDVTAVWADMVRANADQLVEHGNPDLIIPGQSLVVPGAGSPAPPLPTTT